MSKIAILDHGYVEFVEAWGSDERIVEAARMSTQKGFAGWGPKCRACGDSFDDDPERECPSPGAGKPFVDCGRGGHVFDAPGDEKLLAYLWKNNHATPFEMAGLIVEVQAPIFVFREWHRHRTQSYNEASARYAPLPALDFVPTKERVLRGGGHLTKQAGSVSTGPTPEFVDAWLTRLEQKYAADEAFYQWGLAGGIPKELARVGMPVGHYSRMRASANLRNWLGFLTLRADPKAQWEIQECARAVASLVEERFPRTYALFAEGRR